MVTSAMVIVFVSCNALCTATLFVELVAARRDGLKIYVDRPYTQSFTTFLKTLLYALRFVSAPLFFILDLFSLKFLETMGRAIRIKILSLGRNSKGRSYA